MSGSQELDPRPHRSLRVLVADDEAPIRLAVRLMLEERGHRVAEANDAGAAFRMAASDRFDVLLLDVRMPGGGLELLRRMREPQLEGSPLAGSGSELASRTIILSADVTTPRTAAVIAAGQPHLRKPFRFEELVELVERVGG